MKIFGYILAAAVIAVALPAQAWSGSGFVRNIATTPNGVVIFVVDEQPNAPACSAFVNAFAFDGSTPAGKNTYALLLAAASAKKVIWVGGSGKCEVLADRETAWFLQVSF